MVSAKFSNQLQLHFRAFLLGRRLEAKLTLLEICAEHVTTVLAVVRVSGARLLELTLVVGRGRMGVRDVG